MALSEKKLLTALPKLNSRRVDISTYRCFNPSALMRDVSVEGFHVE